MLPLLKGHLYTGDTCLGPEGVPSMEVPLYNVEGKDRLKSFIKSSEKSAPLDWSERVHYISAVMKLPYVKLELSITTLYFIRDVLQCNEMCAWLPPISSSPDRSRVRTFSCFPFFFSFSF